MLACAWLGADNAGISGSKGKIQVPGRRRAGSARQQGGLLLPSFVRFHPGPTDCVADIGPLYVLSAGTTVSAVQLFERLPERPVITMPLVTRLLSVTKPTAGKAIDVLMSAGILGSWGTKARPAVSIRALDSTTRLILPGLI